VAAGGGKGRAAVSDDDGLPADWLMVPLAELLVGIETGKSFKCEERPPTAGEIGVVKVSAVTWGAYQEEESKTCTDAERVNPAMFVQPGDFLFSRANTMELVGACVIARHVNLHVMLSDKILRFRFVQEAMKPWVLSLLRSRSGRQQTEALASGNPDSMRNIGQERIGQILVPLPPSRKQTRIVDKLEELLSDLDAGVAELKAAQKKLAQYRQSLLNAAVSFATRRIGSSAVLN
jgi:type I restriction enzyme, S subunit